MIFDSFASPYEKSGADTINLLPEKLLFMWDDENLLVQFVQMCKLGTFSVFEDLINFVWSVILLEIFHFSAVIFWKF